LPQITQFWVNKYADVTNSSVSKEELLRAADAGLRFVSGGPDNMPRGDDYRTSFDAEAISHMYDVRAVFTSVRILAMILAAVILVLGSVLVNRAQYKALGQALSWAATLTLVLVLALTVFGWLNFDALFILMHQILFEEGTWSFQYNSLLITTYPFDFWIAMAASWAFVLVLICVVALLIGQRLKSAKSIKQT